MCCSLAIFHKVSLGFSLTDILFFIFGQPNPEEKIYFAEIFELLTVSETLESKLFLLTKIEVSM